MLKLKYLFENFELAKLALTNWEHDEDTLNEYLKYFRISSNAVYPFAIRGKRHFLRLSPMEEKQEENLKGELEFLQYLRENGYGAMKPIAAKNGELLLTLNTEWGVYYASVFEGVDGISVEDTDYREEIMIAYGKALGRLHNLSVEYQKQYPEKGPQLEKMQNEAETVKQELSKLKQTKETFGLVHYDFEPDNVFYNEEDGSCHVIDFEDGMYHFFLVDLEQVLDALSEELAGEAFAQAKKYFLQGYESEKALEPDYGQRLPLMRKFCNLFSYARLIRCIAEEVPDAPEWMVSLKDRLAEKIQYLECII